MSPTDEVTAAASDGTQRPEDRLRRLAEAVLGASIEGGSTLLPGRLPETWPRELIPPAPATVLGGVTGGATIAVFEYGSAGPRASDAYLAMLEADGWSPPEMGPGTSIGLGSTTVTMLTKGDALAFIRYLSDDAHGSRLVISYNPTGGAALRGPSQFRRLQGPRLPHIRPPEGVRRDRGSGSSGTDGQRVEHSTLETDRAPSELPPHYVDAVVKAGWKLGAADAGDSYATQWIETTTADGRIWRGVVAIYVVGSMREVFTYMATARE